MRESQFRCVLPVLALLLGCGPDTAYPGGTHTEVLGRLGVNTALPPRSQRPGYNPLSTKRRQLHRLAEVYIAGIPSPAGGRQILRGDSTESYDVLPIEPAGDWAKLPKVSAYGDFDGDGREEIALLVINTDKASADYGRLYVRIIEDKAEGWAAQDKTLATLTSAEMSRFDSVDYSTLDIASGDVDGDGKDEILTTCLSDLRVVDDRSTQYAALFSKTFPLQSGAIQILRVSAGDTDGDGTAEMVVVDSQTTPSGASRKGTAQIHIYDELVEVKSGPAEVTIQGTEYKLMTSDVAVADVDGDRLAEIVLAGRRSETDQVVALVIEDGLASTPYATQQVFFSTTVPSSAPLVQLAAGDLDGDTRAEIVCGRHILKVENSGGLVTRALLPDNVGTGPVISIGDVDNDWKDDVVYITGSGDSVVIYGTDAQGTYGQRHTLPLPKDWSFPTLTTVNTDDDSAVVEFLGHEMLFTKPCILAVMAAPPSYREVPMDLALAGTSFGK